MQIIKEQRINNIIFSKIALNDETLFMTKCEYIPNQKITTISENDIELAKIVSDYVLDEQHNTFSIIHTVELDNKKFEVVGKQYDAVVLEVCKKLLEIKKSILDKSKKPAKINKK